MQIGKIMAAKVEQRLSNGVVTVNMLRASNVEYNRVSLICVLYRILLFWRIYQQSYCWILFSCAVLATRGVKEDWKGTGKEFLAVFMVNC
jgi:hypothetical protein